MPSLVLFTQVWYTRNNSIPKSCYICAESLRKIQKRSTALKKAVATALVLIAGAAVVLWYGNTLNSWVLGGLIGGFAALLLSIPISLTLFTYLSHRHEERLQAEKEAEEAKRHE